jgi:hypothetical protein
MPDRIDLPGRRVLHAVDLPGLPELRRDRHVQHHDFERRRHDWHDLHGHKYVWCYGRVQEEERRDVPRRQRLRQRKMRG